MKEEQKHYLITGGAGFIGSNLIKTLLKDKTVHITCLDNFDPFYSRQIKLQNLSYFSKSRHFSLLNINLDTATVDNLTEAIPQPVDVIIHLAAKAGIRPSISNPSAYYQTNVMGTQILLDFAVQKKVKKFVFASSSSVYGVNKHLPWKENEVVLPISPYAATKLCSEGAGYVYNQLHGLSFIALRLFTVYGPGQRPDLAIYRFTKAIINSEPVTLFGDGTTSRDYTYVDDIVAGVIAAINYNKSSFEIINLGNNHSIALRDLMAALENITGKKAIIDRQPEQPGDVPHTFADITKAQKLLQYHPHVTLEQGLQKFYNWFLQYKEFLINS